MQLVPRALACASLLALRLCVAAAASLRVAEVRAAAAPFSDSRRPWRPRPQHAVAFTEAGAAGAISPSLMDLPPEILAQNVRLDEMKKRALSVGSVSALATKRRPALTRHLFSPR